VIISPEYNAGMTPVLVNTISWLSRQKQGQWRRAVFGLAPSQPGDMAA